MAIRLKREGSHAVRIPPELPTTSMAVKPVSWEGRKEAAVSLSIELSLVS
jgi:hypothetical protein